MYNLIREERQKDFEKMESLLDDSKPLTPYKVEHHDEYISMYRNVIVYNHIQSYCWYTEQKLLWM
jgi:hypothetical protein